MIWSPGGKPTNPVMIIPQLRGHNCSEGAVYYFPHLRPPKIGVWGVGLERQYSDGFTISIIFVLWANQAQLRLPRDCYLPHKKIKICNYIYKTLKFSLRHMLLFKNKILCERSEPPSPNKYHSSYMLGCHLHNLILKIFFKIMQPIFYHIWSPFYQTLSFHNR